MDVFVAGWSKGFHSKERLHIHKSYNRDMYTCTWYIRISEIHIFKHCLLLVQRHVWLFLKRHYKCTCIFSINVKFDDCPSCSSYSKIWLMNDTITDFPITLVLKHKKYILLSVYYNFISYHLNLRNINNVSVDIRY